MISNERPSPYWYRPNQFPTKPRLDEATLKTGTIEIERKVFVFMLKENPRGRFLRITEAVNGRKDSVMIPASGLEEFRKILDNIVRAAGEIHTKA